MADLAQEVIQKLISSDKELTNAIKTTAKKFVGSKGFETKVAEAIMDEISGNLGHYLDDDVLTDAVGDAVKKLIPSIMELPKVKAKFEAELARKVDNEVRDTIEYLFDDEESFRDDYYKCVEAAARERLNLPKIEKKNKK